LKAQDSIDTIETFYVVVNLLSFTRSHYENENEKKLHPRLTILDLYSGRLSAASLIANQSFVQA
jgi:hypothetical protein